MDDHTCMVEVARYYLQFLAGESCGKCVPCREGIERMLEVISRICEGRGEEDDLVMLEDLGETLQLASSCALGKTAPNPVLSTLKYFREEYESHIRQHRCAAGVCRSLTEFYVDPEKCNGCGLCEKNCPVNAILGEMKQPHTIKQDVCIRCGDCFNRCNSQAVKVK